MVALKPHQQKAVDELSDGKILLGGVGSGKTHTALAYYMKEHSNKDVYVITTARKRDDLDWQETAAAFGVGKRDGTVAGELTVDSWNNIAKYAGISGAFFIFDEQRLVGKGAWVKTFLALAKKNRWILLSATPGDTWMDYCPVFIANGFYKNRTDFVRRHVVYNQYTKFPSIDRYVDTGVLVRRRKQVIVHMPYFRRTTRHIQTVTVSHDQDLFERVKEQRWNIYEDRPIKDVGELFRVMRKLVNSDRSRLDALQMLMDQHPKLIVFYNFDYELEMLRTFLTDIQSSTSTSETLSGTESLKTSTTDGRLTRSCTSSSTKPTGTEQTQPTKPGAPYLEIAEWNGHKHEEVPDGDRWVYLVQYTAGSEAWNCITTDAMVFFSLTYSYKVFEQCQGRIDRLNTPFKDLYYYVLRSPTFIDGAIWRSLMAKRDFNERKFAKDFG